MYHARYNTSFLCVCGRDGRGHDYVLLLPVCVCACVAVMGRAMTTGDSGAAEMLGHVSR